MRTVGAEMNATGPGKALRAGALPPGIELNGTSYGLERRFKHNALSAVGLYGAGDDRVVLKCYRERPALFLPLQWAGRMMRDHEAAVMRRVHDLPGVPRLRGIYGPTGIVRDFVPGRHLTRDSDVDDRFFPRLFRMLRRIHRRGMAYVDLEKAENILIGQDGRPYLIDFQIAFHVQRPSLAKSRPARWLLSQLQEADMYHARKHFRRVKSEELTEKQKRYLRRKPWFVEFANALHSPLKALRRKIQGKT